MTHYILSHLSDQTLLRDLHAHLARDRATTAIVLAHLAEVDARKLYLPAAYPSMYRYCVSELRLSEDSACKRIRAARAARQFPAIFDALAEGRLNLSTVVLLGPYLTPETADELLGAAANKTRAEIEQLLAERFPVRQVPSRLQALPPSRSLTARQFAPVQADLSATGSDLSATESDLSASEPVNPSAELLGPSAPGRMNLPAPRPKLTPLAPQRYALQVTIGQETHDKLRHAQALLSHQIPSGDVAEVLDRALDALICQLERRKFAATARPRPPRSHGRAAAGGRYIPAEIKRAVWERDEGRCTFVGDGGRRCPAREFLEFDHVDEVARGGLATLDRIRIRCRAHNQYGAELAFGTGFMNRKREEARRTMKEARAAARNSVEAAITPGASLEEQLNGALSDLAPV